MIDVHEESMVALGDVPDLLPLRRGRKIHVTSVHRWCHRGIGGTRLEMLTIGGIAYTSREALTRFMVETTKARQPAVHGNSP